MGTRNSVIVIANNEPKIAKYCQWDGYPSGRGIELLEVLHKHKDNFSGMKEKVSGVKSLTKDEIDERWKSLGNDSFMTTNPHLLRDMGGGELLDLIMEDKVNETHLYVDFVGDSLFCEWAYVVDLDKNTLEVYKGFNQTPLTPEDRFFDKTEEGSEYHPVKLVVEYSLNDLPEGYQFLADTNKEDEDEE